MSLTVEQRENRHKHLGSSDIPAIMGFSRFSNAYDIWLLKTQRVQPKEKTQDYIQAGNLLEPAVLRWCSKHLNSPIITDGPRLERRIELSNIEGLSVPLIFHMDGEVQPTLDPVEAKTEGVDHPIIEPWGEAGTDEVPEYTCIQAHCHMMATDREICHVPTFLGGRGFGYFFVKRDNHIVELIKKQAIDFWENHVLKDVPPENIAPSLAMIKRIRGVDGPSVKLETVMVQSWIDARQDRLDAQKNEEFHHCGILAALDGNPIGKYLADEEGEKIERFITNFKQTRRGIDNKALKADLPEIHEKYYRTGEPYPVMRMAKQLKKRK